MKKLIFALLPILAMVSCNIETIDAPDPEPDSFTTGVVATIPAVEFEPETKTTITPNLSFGWKEGDVMGIVPTDGTTPQTSYIVAEVGTDPKQAHFDGGSWAVKSGKEYAAYYPYQSIVATSDDNIVLHFDGQSQSENNSTANLGDFDYMYASASASGDGNVSFNFNHLVTIVRFQISAEAGVYSELRLSTEDEIFVQTAELSLGSGELVPKTMTSQLSMLLDDITLSQDGTLTLWMIFCQSSTLVDKNITVSLIDNEGNETKYAIKGMAHNPGKAKAYSVTSKVAEFCHLPTGPDFNAAVKSAAGDDARNVQKITFKTGQVVTNTTAGYDITYNSATNEVVVSTNAEMFKFRDDSYNMFDGFNMMTAIEGFEKIDASAANDISEMFMDCSSLESLDLSNFKPNYLGSMYGMFEGCSSLRSLDLSGFNKENTEEIEDYSRMFYLCSSLTSLDLSSFEFSFAMDVSSMFEGCSSLESVSFGDMPQYTNSYMLMNSMFKDCINLKSVDFSGWGIIIPRDIEKMFYDCRKLKTLIFPEISELELASTADMFYNLGISNYIPGGESASIPGTTICCSEHTYSIIRNELDDLLKYKFVLPEIIEPAELPAGPDFNAAIKAFETDGTPIRRIEFIVREDPSYLGGTKINSGFPGVYAQYSGGRLVLSTMAASYKSSADCSQMFAGLGNLEYVDRTENVDFSPATDMAHMFNKCSKLRGFWFPSCDYSHVTKMNGMFSNCTSLNSDEINLKELSTESVTLMEQMFMNCGMSSYDLSSFNTANVQSMNKMFLAAANAESINFGNYFVIPSGCRVSYIIERVADTSGKCWISCSDAVWSCLTTASGTGYDPTKHFRTENYSVLPSDLKSIMNRRNTQRISFHANATAPNDGWTTATELPGTSGCPVYYVTDNFGYEYDFYTTASEFRLPADASGYFKMSSVDPQILSQLATLEGLQYFNTSNVINMSGMFEDARYVQTLDLSSFDTSNVTDFSSFLAGCNSMQTVKFGDKFKISNGAVLTDFGAGLGSRNSAEEYNTIFYCPSTAWNTLLANWSICFYNGYNYCNKNASTDIGFDGGDNGGGNPITD